MREQIGERDIDEGGSDKDWKRPGISERRLPLPGIMIDNYIEDFRVGPDTRLFV